MNLRNESVLSSILHLVIKLLRMCKTNFINWKVSKQLTTDGSFNPANVLYFKYKNCELTAIIYVTCM